MTNILDGSCISVIWQCDYAQLYIVLILLDKFCQWKIPMLELYIHLCIRLCTKNIRIWVGGGNLTESYIKYNIYIKPQKLQQNKIVRICLNKDNFEGSTQQNLGALKCCQLISSTKS